MTRRDFFDSLSSHWENFQRRADPCAPFMHPAYLGLWLDTLGKEARPRVVAAWDDEDLVGYAPFMETIDSLGPFSISTLKFLGNNIGYPGDVLYATISASEPRMPLVKGILLYLKHSTRVRKWDLGYLDPRSPSYVGVRDVLHWAPDTEPMPSQQFVSLNLPGSWDAYLMQLSPKTRKNFRRALQSLGERGEVNLSVVREEPMASQRVAELIQNHLRWWEGTPKEEWFGDDAVRRFLVSGAQVLAALDQYLAFALEVDGKPVAWSVGPFDGQRYFEHLVSYDRTYRSASPGMILSILLMQHLLSMDIYRVELGPGFDQRKRSLGGKPTVFPRVHGYRGWLRRIIRFRRVWMRGGTR